MLRLIAKVGSVSRPSALFQVTRTASSCVLYKCGSANHPHNLAALNQCTISPSKRHLSSAKEIISFNVQDPDDFKDRVLNSDIPVLVDFHADWCHPCKILAPRLESLVAKKPDKVCIAKVDINDMTDLAMEYDVTAVPTVVAVKHGKIFDKFVGLLDDDKLESFINKLVD